MGNTQHLLVIRLSAMGDVAMTVPVIKSLLDTYPNLKITVLTKEFLTPIFYGLENVSVHIADVKAGHKGIIGLWKLYNELKSLKIDAVADLHHVLRSTILKQFFRWDGVPFVQVDKGRKEKKALTAKKSKIFRALKTTQQRYVDVFTQLGLPFTLPVANFLGKRKLSKNVLAMTGNNSRKWLGIAPFAAFSGKMYPLQLMGQVIQELNNTNKYKIFLFGGGEKEVNQLEAWAKAYKDCVNIASRLSFEDQLVLISNLDLMLSMDSGNAHLAAMYGIPTITLWGVTHPHAGFYPYGQDPENALLSDRSVYPLLPTSVYGNKLPKGYENVMETIDPNAILDKVNLLLHKQ